MKRVLLGLLLLVASSVVLPTSVNAVESCKEFNLRERFNFGYNTEFPTWNVLGSQKVITWATMDSGELNGKKIQRSFGTTTQDWLREAFQSWDDALDSIIFKEVPFSEDIDIKIGWTQVLALDYESIFNVKAPNGLRSNATIEFKYQSPFLIFKENFIQAAQSDIGHVLGMGYITPSSEIISVMEWPFQAPYGQVPLGEFDVSLIRAIYSESTCPSTFNPVIQANIKAKQEAELKAKQEAELKAKQEAELKAKQEAEAYAAAEVKAKQEADAKAAAEKLVVDARAEALKILAAAKTAALKKVTITCIKGKLTKKVTAAKPKCPAGYKKK